MIKGPAPRKVLEQASRTKSKSVTKDGCQTAYDPTNAIRCNDAEHRRWVRVKEWFNEFAETENNHRENEKGHIIELLKSA